MCTQPPPRWRRRRGAAEEVRARVVKAGLMRLIVTVAGLASSVIAAR
jgi:hypothetical protein